MKRTMVLAVSLSLAGLFVTAHAARVVFQDGQSGYAGTQDAQIRAGHADDNYANSWEYSLTNCNT